MVSAMSASSWHTKPVTPSSTISGAAPSAIGQHGRPAGHRLDHHQSERLRPPDGIEESTGAGEELQLLGMGDLAQVLEIGVEVGPDVHVEVLVLPRLAHLGGHEQADAGLVGRLHRPVGALARRHPPEEEEVVAVARPHREVLGIEAVVDDPGDGDLGHVAALGVGDGDDRCALADAPVEVDELLVERSVHGGDDLQALEALGVERSHHGVVVDDVVVLDGVVGGHDVAQFGDGGAETDALGLGEGPRLRHRAGRVARGVQQDVVAGPGEAAGQQVDDELDATVESRRYRRPRRRDQGYAHEMIKPRLG